MRLYCANAFPRRDAAWPTGAVLLIASLTFRTLDQPVCGALPFGTHFLWHVLNAVMLGWMIEVWRRHRPR